MPRGKRLNNGERDAQAEALISELRVKAFELKKAGATYRAIGSQLGISHEMARQYVFDALKELKALEHETAEDYRQMELERLDRLQAAHWQKAIGTQQIAPSESSGKIILKVIETRAKLLGLFVEKHEMTGANGGKIEFDISLPTLPEDTLDKLIGS